MCMKVKGICKSIEDYKRYWDNFDPSLYALIKQVKKYEQKEK